MPKKFLVLDRDSGLIAAMDGQPEAPYTAERRHQAVLSNLVSVWCEIGVSDEKFREAAAMFEARTGRVKLIEDVNSAVTQLQQLVTETGCGFLALGGSPKLVKWALKWRGFKVSTINVSEVKIGGRPTDEFLAYLERKLAKLGSPGLLVVMDFADTGASLIKIQEDVKRLRPNAKVMTVAVGTSHEFYKIGNTANREKINKVLVGIDGLQKALFEQQLKLYVLGRNKKKNPYADWSLATAAKLETTVIKTMPAHELFKQQKSLWPTALSLPLMEVNVSDLMDEGAGSSCEDEAEVDFL